MTTFDTETKAACPPSIVKPTTEFTFRLTADMVKTLIMQAAAVPLGLGDVTPAQITIGWETVELPVTVHLNPDALKAERVASEVRETLSGMGSNPDRDHTLDRLQAGMAAAEASANAADRVRRGAQPPKLSEDARRLAAEVLAMDTPDSGDAVDALAEIARTGPGIGDISS